MRGFENVNTNRYVINQLVLVLNNNLQYYRSMQSETTVVCLPFVDRQGNLFIIIVEFLC